MTASRIAFPALLAAALSSSSFVATAQPLDEAGITDLISGKRVFLATPYGVELPLSYGADGNVKGDVSGIALARMFSPRETGRWWVAEGRLCQQWPNWYDGKALCFTVEETGPGRIAWVRQDGLSGTARIVD